MRVLNVILTVMIVISLTFTFFNTRPNQASFNSVDITFYSNKILISPNEQITLFVGLRNGNNWLVGSITLRDITTSTEKDYSINAGLNTISDFLITSPEGLHIIEATDGILVESLTLIVRDPSNQGTFISALGINSFNPSPNVDSSFILNVSLAVQGYFALPFDGTENIYVKSNGLIGSPILSSYWFPAGGHVLPIILNLTIPIPLWHPIGLYEFEVGFTGDGNINQTKTVIYLFVSNDDFILEIVPESSEVDRSSLETINQLSVDLLLGGKEITLNNLYYNVTLLTANGSRNLAPPFLIGNRDRSIMLDVPTQIPLGDAILIVDILDSMDDLLFSNQTNILIYDTVNLIISPNEPDVRAGDTINFLALSSLTDRPNTLIESTIVVKNTTTILGTGNTSNGEWNFNYKVPNYLVLGSYTMIWEVHPLNVNSSLIRSQSITKSYTVSIPTEFQISNFPSQIFRNKNLDFDVQLLSQGFPLIGNAGTFDLIQDSDLSIIGSYNANQSNNINFLIDSNLPKGNYGLKLNYYGNGVYEPSSKDLDLKILSRPNFVNILTNASSGVIGETIKISGFLVEENPSKSPVFNATVEILVSDGLSQWVHGTSITDVTGAFSHNLPITSDLSIGVHFVRLRFTGKPLEYYGSATNEPIVNFDKDNVLTLDIPDSLEAGAVFNFSVTGKLNGKYQLQYLDTEKQTWIGFKNVSLDNYGKFYGQATTPSLKGLAYFRIFDMLDNSSFIIHELEISIRPIIQIEIDEIIYSKQEVLFRFYSDQLYVVYLNDLRITPSGQVWIEEEFYQRIFNFPGNYSLKVELIGDYLIPVNNTVDFIVYESYDIIRSSPNIITEGSSVTVNIQIQGKTIGLIQSVLVQIVNTKTQIIVAEGLTQSNGNLTLSAPIFGDETELVIKVPTQHIGNYFILEASIPLATKIRRSLIIEFEQEYSFTLNEKNTINLPVKYSGNNNPAPNIPFLISVYQGDSLISNFSLQSSTEGFIDIPLGTLSEGTYQFSISPASEDYAPFIIVVLVSISAEADSFNEAGTLSLVLIGGLTVVGIGVITRLRA